MLRCEATLLPETSPGEATITIGERCPEGAGCLVRSPWFPTADARPRVHDLRCAAPPGPLVHPPARPDVAAFRCVLPRGALTPDRATR
jgi:hypothetical protein